MRFRIASKITRETNTAVNKFASRPKVKVTANPFTGPVPNPLAARCDRTLAVPSPESQVVQELHLVATHLLCEYVDDYLPEVLERTAIEEDYAEAVAS